jgi:hypothetical protein
MWPVFAAPAFTILHTDARVLEITCMHVENISEFCFRMELQRYRLLKG